MPRESKKALRFRAQRIRKVLFETHADAHCELDYTDAFELLCATLLSAQCTDKVVNTVTPALFRRFPDVSQLAKARPSELERIIRPTVTTFLDFAFGSQRTDIQMEEIPIRPSSVLNGVMLKDSGIRQNYNLIIIAIKKPDGSMLFNPSFEAVIRSGETVIAVGEKENLQKLEHIL